MSIFLGDIALLICQIVSPNKARQDRIDSAIGTGEDCNVNVVSNALRFDAISS